MRILTKPAVHQNLTYTNHNDSKAIRQRFLRSAICNLFFSHLGKSIYDLPLFRFDEVCNTMN